MTVNEAIAKAGELEIPTEDQLMAVAQTFATVAWSTVAAFVGIAGLFYLGHCWKERKR